MSTLLRPNAAMVVRTPLTGTIGRDGTPIPADPQTIYAALPCMIDGASGMVNRAQLATAAGSQPDILGDFILVADGVSVHGYTAGEHVTVRGVDMVVAGNLRGAFPDIQVNDTVTDENGVSYAVLGVQRYYDVYPNIQAYLQKGKG